MTIRDNKLFLYEALELRLLKFEGRSYRIKEATLL
jgi:hypothetical protein